MLPPHPPPDQKCGDQPVCGQHGEEGEWESWLLQLSRHGWKPGERLLRLQWFPCQEWDDDEYSQSLFISSAVYQVFSYTADKEIRTDDLCLDVSRLNGPVLMLKCHHMKGNQMFEYDAEVGSRWSIPPWWQPIDWNVFICSASRVGGFTYWCTLQSALSLKACFSPPDGAVWQYVERKLFLLSSVFSLCVLLFSHSMLENGNMILR